MRQIVELKYTHSSPLFLLSCVIHVNAMTIQAAKKLSLEAVLAHFGHYPVDIRKNGDDLWYLSPFRKERVPSFHISASRNIWYDFEGRGGNLLDFVMHYKACDLRMALAYLSQYFNHVDFGTPAKKIPAPKAIQPGLELVKVKSLQHPSLLKYLDERRVNSDLASKFLKEIYFRKSKYNKTYFALGFKNGRGGYELRNAYFKGVVGQKGITLLGGRDQSIIQVFEGFMDFLSYLSYENLYTPPAHVLILNSLSHLPLAIELIRGGNYQLVQTFLDNDEAGAIATQKLLTAFPQKGAKQGSGYSHLDIEAYLQLIQTQPTLQLPEVQTQNFRYKPYKDFNEFLEKNRKEISG